MADKEYIEREALERYIRKEFSHLAGLLNYIRIYCPTADVVEVRHGKWVPSLHHYGLYMCSECRCSDEKCQPVFDRKNSWKSCPNCGATMDGKGDDE